MPRLKPSDFNSVREAVQKFEGNTRGELVPLVVRDADDYGWVKYQTGFFGFLAALLLGEAWSFLRTWPLDAMEVTCISIFGALLGLAVGKVPGVARRVIGRAQISQNVHRRALAEFI